MPSHLVERKSTHPYLHSVWQSQTQGQESIVIGAKSTWDIIVITCDGYVRVQLSAPHKYPQPMDVGMGESVNYFTGLRFSPGVYVPDAIQQITKDRNTIDLVVIENDMLIGDNRLPVPSYDTAEFFVETAQSRGVFLQDKVIDQILTKPEITTLAPRMIQRRFLRKIGMSKTQVQQLNRAEYAASLMNDGMTAAKAASVAGYADQAHMTRTFKVLFGKTPKTLDKGYRETDDEI